VDSPPVAVVGDSNGAISMWAIDRDQRAFGHLDAPQESLPLPLPTRLAGLPCREDHCTPITLFGASLTKSRQTGTGVQISGAVFVRRLIMRLYKAAGEVFRAASAAVAVAGSGPAGHQCQRGPGSSSGWPAGPPLRGHRRPPSAAALPGCRPCCAQRRREEVSGMEFQLRRGPWRIGRRPMQGCVLAR
jgi:hypothetical protein